MDMFPETSFEIFINITSTNIPAKLVVMKASSNPSVIQPEQEFTVAFGLWNTGTLTAENVTVDIENAGEFHVLNNITKQYFFELKGLNNRDYISLEIKKIWRQEHIP